MLVARLNVWIVLYGDSTALSACMSLNNSSTVYVARPTKPKPISASIAIKPTHFVVVFLLFFFVSLFVSHSTIVIGVILTTLIQRPMFGFHIFFVVVVVRYSFDSSVCLSPDPKCLFIRTKISIESTAKKIKIKIATNENNILNRTGSIVHSSVCDCRTHFFLLLLIRLGQTNWMSKWMAVCVRVSLCGSKVDTNIMRNSLKTCSLSK